MMAHLLGGLGRRGRLLELLALLLLLEEGVRADLALLNVSRIVRRLARERHVPVVEARDALEVLLGVGLVRHRLEHLLDVLRLVALLDAVLVVADEEADVVALVVLILAFAEPDDGRRLGGREVHHVLELEVAELLLELLNVERAEALAAKVWHGLLVLVD